MITTFNVGDLFVEESTNKKVILFYGIILDVYADFYVYQMLGQDPTHYHMRAAIAIAHKRWKKVS
jgi:hypothetical protein